MADTSRPPLPIGYWLKRADALLTARIDEAQQMQGLIRTEWQLLNWLQESGATNQVPLTEAMRPFADAAALAAAVDHLQQRGLVEGDGSAAAGYRLTEAGRHLHGAALVAQQAVRQRAMQGISADEYAQVVAVLQRLVTNLDDSPALKAAPAAAPNRSAPVDGIGGFFFRARDPQALGQWYEEHFGITGPAGPTIWRQAAGPTVFAPFEAETDYFGRREQAYMLNFRVRDLDALLARLGAAGVRIDPTRQDEPYGRFAWVYDPDGTRIELWEPIEPDAGEQPAAPADQAAADRP